MLHPRLSLSQTPAPWTRRIWTSPSSAKSAPGPPSLMLRSSSWSAASTTSGTCPARSGRTWRRPWSSQRLRSRSGSRTAGTRRNAARWPPTWWRRPRQLKRWRWKFWCGTTRDSTARERSYGPRCSPCSRPTITHTPTASLRGHSLHVQGISENSVTVFIHFCFYHFAPRKSNLLYIYIFFFSDKRRRPEGTAQRLWLNWLMLSRPDQGFPNFFVTSSKRLKTTLSSMKCKSPSRETPLKNIFPSCML